MQGHIFFCSYIHFLIFITCNSRVLAIDSLLVLVNQDHHSLVPVTYTVSLGIHSYVPGLWSLSSSWSGTVLNTYCQNTADIPGFSNCSFVSLGYTLLDFSLQVFPLSISSWVQTTATSSQNSVGKLLNAAARQGLLLFQKASGFTVVSWNPRGHLALSSCHFKRQLGQIRSSRMEI